MVKQVVRIKYVQFCWAEWWSASRLRVEMSETKWFMVNWPQTGNLFTGERGIPGNLFTRERGNDFKRLAVEGRTEEKRRINGQFDVEYSESEVRGGFWARIRGENFLNWWVTGPKTYIYLVQGNRVESRFTCPSLTNSLIRKRVTGSILLSNLTIYYVVLEYLLISCLVSENSVNITVMDV